MTKPVFFGGVSDTLQLACNDSDGFGASHRNPET